MIYDRSLWNASQIATAAASWKEGGMPDLDGDFPPTIDLTSREAPAQIDDVCRDVGFFQIRGHGIPDDLVAELFRAADEFFGQDLDQKMRWSSSQVEVERGYSAKGTEGFSYSLALEQPPDLMEGFSMGLEPLPDRPEFHTDAHYFFAPNIWPDEPAGLREVMTAYWDEGNRVIHQITTLMARSLGLDEDYFEPFTDASTDTLRINYFEGKPGETALPGQFGIGPHTDYGMCTLLLADQEPALQVYTKEGEWRYIVPQAGALLVNLGDLMARWTNDRWRSTLHRVTPVLASDGERRRRRSIPFFHEGNFDAYVECLPTCTSPDNPPRYPPITGGQHVFEKAIASRELRKADADSTVGDRADALA
jgi:isopenicillin N synthase-like dioxygenase